MKHARPVSHALVHDLRAAVEAWAFRFELRHNAIATRKRIAADRVKCLSHLNELRSRITKDLPPRERGGHLAALDRLETALAVSGRWDLEARLTLPPHRPVDKPTRDALRAAVKRHRIDATTAAKAIRQHIAPRLSAATRAALLGPSRDPANQVEYLADKWLRRSR